MRIACRSPNELKPVSVRPVGTTCDATRLGRSGHDERKIGRVTLVGAGPGDPELLTVKAIRALQCADVILFDALVSDEVLAFARGEAKRILVGKRAGRPSCSQDEINDLMVKLARQGMHVVRLKSGDPMIFARAGEEIGRLDSEGIPVEVVPGITAGVALAATLGVSLTHRDLARSVRFVTGHSRQGGLPSDLDWRAMADPSTTTIFYMAGRTGAEIADKLMRFGLESETPVVIATALGRTGEEVWRGDLRGLSTYGPHETPEPVVIGVGRAFNVRRKVEGSARRVSVPVRI